MASHRSPTLSRLRGLAPVLLLAALAFVASLVISRQVFQGQYITGDEHSYVFQAGNFLDGLIKRPAPLFDRLLRYDMIILHPEKGWLSRYPPAHCLWLMPGVAVGVPHLMSALAAALSVSLAYFIGLRLRIPGVLLPLLLLLSPFFLLMHGTVLSHTSGLLATSLMFLAYLVWRQDKRPVWALVAGLAWAFFFLNRTWTALLVALPFGVDSLLQLARARDGKRDWRGTLYFAGSALLGPVLYTVYNYLATGDGRLPTYLYYEASEGLGFGRRRTQGMVVEHTLVNGLGYLWDNLRRLDAWMLGVPGLLIPWLLVAIHGWSRRWSSLLGTAIVMVMAGYVAFWFPGITEVGPVYYTETLLFLLVLGGLGLARLWRRCRGQRAIRVFVAGALLITLTGLSTRFTLMNARELRTKLHPQAELAKALDALPGRPLVFWGGFSRAMDHVVGFNPRGLDSRVLLIRSTGDNDAVFARAFPGRTPYLLTGGSSFSLRPLPEELGMHTRGRATHFQRGSNQGDSRVADVPDEPGLMSFGWYRFLPKGRYRVEFILDLAGVEPERPVRVEVVGDKGRKILAHQTCTHTNGTVTLEFEVAETLEEIEPRVQYGGSGRATLHQIRLNPLSLPNQD